MSRVRVMIVDDHEMLRLGLRTALETESDIQVAGEAGSAEAAIRTAQEVRPDVILMDVRMPGADGIEACRNIKERMSQAKIIMFTSFTDEQAVLASIMAGAAGYLLKNVGRAELLRAIRTVAKGESLLDPAVTTAVLAKIKSMAGAADPQVSLLSEREREVLVLVAEGCTNKEIAERLVITEHTARNHVSRILDKLGLSRRSEAATFAAQHGLLKKKDQGTS